MCDVARQICLKPQIDLTFSVLRSRCSSDKDLGCHFERILRKEPNFHNGSILSSKAKQTRIKTLMNCVLNLATLYAVVLHSDPTTQRPPLTSTSTPISTLATIRPTNNPIRQPLTSKSPNTTNSAVTGSSTTTNSPSFPGTSNPTASNPVSTNATSSPSFNKTSGLKSERSQIQGIPAITTTLMLVAILGSSTLIVVIGGIHALCARVENFRPLCILVFGFMLTDFMTDILFILLLFSLRKYLLMILSGLSLGLSLIANLVRDACFKLSF